MKTGMFTTFMSPLGTAERWRIFGYCCHLQLSRQRYQNVAVWHRYHLGEPCDEFEIVITPNAVDADTMREFADMGVDRLVLQMGSQRTYKVNKRLSEVEALVLVKVCA